MFRYRDEPGFESIISGGQEEKDGYEGIEKGEEGFLFCTIGMGSEQKGERENQRIE